MRIKGGPARRRKHKKVLKAIKGYRGTRSKLWRAAHEAYLHAGDYAFIGRKLRKRDMRTLWIQRISAALQPLDISYRKFINLLNKSKIELDRKILADIAVNDPETFKKVVEKVNSKQ